MKANTYAISHPRYARQDTTSTASATLTEQHSTPPRRATISADTTPMVDAIITPATAQTVIIRSTASAIVFLASGIPCQHV